jgi:hypothetical protein
MIIKKLIWNAGSNWYFNDCLGRINGPFPNAEIANDARIDFNAYLFGVPMSRIHKNQAALKAALGKKS